MTYFFHLFTDDATVLDEEGGECADALAVAGRALLCARDLLAADVLNGVLDLNQRIDVVDHEGSTVHSLSFKDAVAVSCR
jgi:hypothetical protein